MTRQIKALIDTATGLVENIIAIDPGAVYDPGAGKSLIDAAGAMIGGTWNGAIFVSPIPPPPVPDTDKAEKAVRGKPEMLALGRIVTGNDALTENDLVTLLRSKL